MFHIETNDPYEVLEISKNADQKTIRDAYKRLALKYHPDRHPKENEQENTIKFQQISDAYEKLSNTSYQKGNITFNDIFKDLYKELFYYSNKNELSIYREIELTLEDIYKGKNIYLNYQRQCPKDEICFICKGTGKLYDTEMRICQSCEGLGKSNELLTQSCSVQIYIEPGFSKKTLFYDEKGHINSHGMAGDLIINIIYKPHKSYIQKDNDLYTTFKLNFKETMLGTTRTLLLLDETEIEIPIDGPVKYGKLLKINRKGINKNGHLYIKLKTSIPDKLTEEQIDAIQKLF